MEFNINVASFVKELDAHIQNVNTIDDETIKLLTKTILAINKLEKHSNFREISPAHEINFVYNLDDDIFDCRRYIVCYLCHVSQLEGNHL